MFKKTLIFGMVLGLLGFRAQAEEKLSLELVKEIRFKERIVDDLGFVNIGLATSREDIERIRKASKLSLDEPIFPIRAITIPGKGVRIFDEKGNIEKEIKEGFLVSENGEYIVSGNEIKTRENKRLWKGNLLSPKTFRGSVLCLSNIGSIVSWETRNEKNKDGKRYFIARLNFYDEEGNLKNFTEITPRYFANRGLKNHFSLSENGETFATWDDGEVLAFSKEGRELFKHRLVPKEMVHSLDKIRVSPDGRFIVVSCFRGRGYLSHPPDYEERLKKVEKELERMLDRGELREGDQFWTKENYDKAYEKLLKEMGIDDKSLLVLDGVGRNTISLFSRDGKLLWEYNVQPGELAISFSPEGDYLGVGDYHNVYLFETETGRLVWKWKNEDTAIGCSGEISLSSNAEYIVVDFRIKKIPYSEYTPAAYIFNKSGEVILKTYIKDLKGIFPVKITPDGKHVIGIRNFKTKPRDGNYGIVIFKRR
ncbi:MAG: hypothetical protein AB1630_09565 [bacterium]